MLAILPSKSVTRDSGDLQRTIETTYLKTDSALYEGAYLFPLTTEEA